MDFPVSEISPPPILTPFNRSSLGEETISSNLVLSGANSGIWATANLARVYPFVLASHAIAHQLLWFVGATSDGNIDIGIYDGEGNRIVSSGSTAMSATVNAVQELNITDTPLAPGRYFLAAACDSSTGTHMRTGWVDEQTLSAWPMYTQTSAFPLPSAITLGFTTELSPLISVVGIQFVPTF